jgi:hypothetical protein
MAFKTGVALVENVRVLFLFSERTLSLDGKKSIAFGWFGIIVSVSALQRATRIIRLRKRKCEACDQTMHVEPCAYEEEAFITA